MYVLTDDSDNVFIALDEKIPNGSKVARTFIRAGREVYKSGFIIGIALSDIEKGELVAINNLGSRYVKY